jgi:hypothetical protein
MEQFCVDVAHGHGLDEHFALMVIKQHFPGCLRCNQPEASPGKRPEAFQFLNIKDLICGFFY